MAQGRKHDAGHVRVVPRLVRLPGGKTDGDMGGVGGKRLTAMKRGSLLQCVGGAGLCACSPPSYRAKSGGKVTATGGGGAPPTHAACSGPSAVSVKPVQGKARTRE